MADFHPILARAIAGLTDKSPEARRAVYDRARTALLAQLRSLDPPLSEADMVRVVDGQIKQRREAIDLYTKGNRPELAAQEQAEIAELEKYMPAQLTREQVKTEVEKVIADLNTREFPKVMKESAARLRGRADGKMVNEVVKELTA